MRKLNSMENCIIMYSSINLTWKTSFFFKVYQFAGDKCSGVQIPTIFLANFNRNVCLFEKNRFLCGIGWAEVWKQKNRLIYLWNKFCLKVWKFLFCVRKAGNFKSLSPVNRLTWKITISFPCHKFTFVHNKIKVRRYRL